MAKAELGVKRTCLSCDMRFYDFNRNPIICPGCGAEFDAENLIKSRKGITVTRVEQKVDTPVTQVDPNDAALVYEDDADTGIDGDADVDMDFDEDDVADKDGPGIIPDDINPGVDLLPDLDERDN